MPRIDWVDSDGDLRPTLGGMPVAWAPLPGSQRAFMECPVFEALLEGVRGPGKTQALIMDYCQHVGRGFGADWRGIIFRQTYPQLTDIIAKSREVIPRIWPAAAFNEQKSCWTWPTGEVLRLAYMRKLSDYWSYHGHQYPFVGWDELTTWANLDCYQRMMSCCRSTKAGMPRKYRATANPYGPGHNAVKARFGLPLPPNRVIGPIIKEHGQPDRVAIRGRLSENLPLMLADPDYLKRLVASSLNAAQLAAWVDGSWDIVAGGMFDDLWEPRYHVVLSLPLRETPAGWRIDRAYDHGQSKPFSVGWWLESNGEPWRTPGGKILGRVRGDLVLAAEWYGWNGKKPNEGIRLPSRRIAQGIAERERDWGIQARVKPGPADSSIFDDFEPGQSVAGEMKLEGVKWTKADKGPGSRKQGWSLLRSMLLGAIPGPEGAREDPGLFVMERCTQFRRTFPVLPRSERDPDDVDSDAEDHVADMVRYRIRRRKVASSVQSI